MEYGFSTWLARTWMWLILVLVVVCASVVQASQVVYRDTDLEGALKASSVVLCGRYLGGDHPARFEVIDTHLGERVPQGSLVHVYSKTSEAWARARRANRRSGVRRSPIVERLPSPPSAELIEESNYCLLLNPGTTDGDYVMSVDDAHIPAPCPALVDMINEGEEGSPAEEESAGSQ